MFEKKTFSHFVNLKEKKHRNKKTFFQYNKYITETETQPARTIKACKHPHILSLSRSKYKLMEGDAQKNIISFRD